MSNSINMMNLFQSPINQTATESKANKLENSLSNLEHRSDEELMEACKSFEAYFLEQVFKSMEKTIMKDEDSTMDSGYSSYFKDMLTQEYANNATETGGYGIAQMMYESMKRQ